MDPNQNIEDTEYSFELAEDETGEESVDDFIRELEAKEKDLHITADTTFIEIASEFEDGEIPDFMRPELPETGSKTVKPTVANKPAASEAGKKLEAEVAELKTRVAGLQEERTELYKNSQRRLKDFEAYKARTERERSETFQRLLSNLATQMLPVLDNLDRALQFASDMPEERQSGFAQFFDGIVLVNQQVNEVLATMGIDAIATVGEQFDPHFHEAVAIDENSEVPPNTITAELLRGFRIGTSVIRHSMVRVSAASVTTPSSEAPKREAGTEPIDSDARREASGKDQQQLAAAEDSMEAFSEDQEAAVEFSNEEPVTNGFEIERNGETE